MNGIIDDKKESKSNECEWCIHVPLLGFVDRVVTFVDHITYIIEYIVKCNKNCGSRVV